MTIDKNKPSQEWIDAVRRRYPCEREVDRILTRKMIRRRDGRRYAPLSLADLCRGLESLLRGEVDADFEITNARWLSGGASKLQMLFDLERTTGSRRTKEPLVLRMETEESVVETSRAREFQILRAIEGKLPAPKPRWIDTDAKHLPYPGLVYTFAPGVTKPTGGSSGVTGVGIAFGAELRRVLAPQFLEHLVTLHTLEWKGADLSAFDVPDTPNRAAEWQVNTLERIWEEDAREEVPLIRVAAAWLRENAPAVDRLSIVHGDFRNGNFLFTEHDRRISAWLDWELAHLGDRHDEFGWMLASFNRSRAEDGSSLVCALFRENDLFEAYEKSSGLSLDPKRLAYYRVFNCFKAAVIPVATGTRVARGGKTHQDALAAWFAGLSYVIFEELRRLLEEVA